MKIAAYEVRPDEKPVIEGLCKKYGIELISTPANLDKTTAHMAAGCDGVTTLGQSDYSNAVLDELKGYGVQVLASRCVGYNHMNCDYARSLGFRLCNGAYAPNGVAEYTVMAILMCIRKFKKALYNTNDNDFTLKGKMGRELRTMTVGVMGTGKIGFTIIKCLSGFGCRIIANDVYENDAVRAYAEYVDLDTLYRESDIITIHTPLLPETTGMIDREAIAKMKAAIDAPGIEVKQLPCRYPQGAEKVLIENCTGREVPFPGLPSDVGVIVMNVTSTAFVGKYLETGMPLTTKRLTVDGDIVKEPKNVEVLIGTPIQELLDFCGGLTAQPGKVLYGGPMMGTCVADLSQPILKNNNAVLAFSEKLARLPKKTNCIHCGRCVNACPLGLAAKDIVKAYDNGNVELLQELNADLCMSCGTCSFVCPAKRPLAPSIALAKIMMKNGGKK